MKVLSIVGARPQFIKLAPISRSLRRHDVEHVVIHTGQHFDMKMSDVFFDELQISEPDYRLDCGGKTSSAQISEVIGKCEPIIFGQKPNVVIVYGDTNTTLGGSVSAKSLKIDLAHIEAGLRSRNREMQEELNRVAVDHLSDFRFCPTPTAMKNLLLENLANNSYLSGDVMKDCFEFAKKSKIPTSLQTSFNSAIFCTIHRAENTDNLERLHSIFLALTKLESKVVIPVHPRLQKNLKKIGMEKSFKNLELIEPLSYFETINAPSKCESVITDSGGLQKDAWFARKQCVTIRNESEWPETLENSWNVICNNLSELTALSQRAYPEIQDENLFGGPLVADGIVSELISIYGIS